MTRDNPMLFNQVLASLISVELQQHGGRASWSELRKFMPRVDPEELRFCLAAMNEAHLIAVNKENFSLLV